MTKYNVKVREAELGRPFTTQEVDLPDETKTEIARIIAKHIPANCWLYCVTLDVHGEFLVPLVPAARAASPSPGAHGGTEGAGKP